MRLAHVFGLVVAGLGCLGCSADPSVMVNQDAAGGGADADTTATCLVKGNYNALGSVTGTAGMASGATTITLVLDPGPPGKDDLFFRLVPGQGAFAGGALTPGTYPISGADAGYKTCGLCTNLIADITMTGPSKFYYAATGSVTLTTVTPPITGTATNLHFTEIDIGTGMTDGPCVADIASVSFTAN